MANVRIGGQGSSLLRSRVTYGSFYLRMGAMCEYRAGLKWALGCENFSNYSHFLAQPCRYITFECVTVPLDVKFKILLFKVHFVIWLE